MRFWLLGTYKVFWAGHRLVLHSETAIFGANLPMRYLFQWLIRLLIHQLYPNKKYHYKKAVVENKGIPATIAKNQPKPDWVIKEVVRLKAILGKKAGCRRVANTFNRLHANSNIKPMTVGKSFVADTIKKHQYQIAVERRDVRNKQPRPFSVNNTWAMDLSFCFIEQRQTVPFIGIIDFGSRKLVSLQLLSNKSSWMLLGYLCIAIAKYGKPKKLRTDNEVIFNSFVFTTFLKLVGIQKQTTQVAAPWQNGRIERAFGTLKPLLKQLVIKDRLVLQSALTEFRYFYNAIRPHQGLNGKTPNEVFYNLDTRKPVKKVTVIKKLDGLLVGLKIKR